ncbi:MAG: hypothetical protein QOJ09_2070 [Actinomycetota bacterium]|jgi:uncharacterized protein (TIGR00730 family)|nr:hypothetical protein [Actinomycetota bacterium]
MTSLRALGVFCGSSSGVRPEYVDAAAQVGTVLAERGIDLVYGGGAVGLMGAMADACLAGGGRVIGVIPVGLFSREVGHAGVTELHEVASMHERKQLMYERSDAFLALPGGYGTLEELAEVTTWSQLGLHAKPVALLDVAGFWNPLVHQLDTMVVEGFLKPENRKLVQLTLSVEAALDHLAAVDPIPVEKWITPGER